MKHKKLSLKYTITPTCFVRLELESEVVNLAEAIYEEPHRIHATVYEVSGEQAGEAADTYSYTDCRSISNRRTEVQGSHGECIHQQMKYIRFF